MFYSAMFVCAYNSSYEISMSTFMRREGGGYLPYLSVEHMKDCSVIYLVISFADMVECMACSDNVVRAGLTPKYVDKDTLCQMLTYNMKSAQENLFVSAVHPLCPYVQVYEPPVTDFGVHRIIIPVSGEHFTLPVIPGPSTMVVICGVLQMECCGVVESLHKGIVIFLPANRSVRFINCTESAMVFRAYYNSQ